MEQLPPHLPKKQGLLINATAWQSVFYFLSFLFIAIFSSLATVFVSLNYIIPRAVPDVKFYTIERSVPQNAPTSFDSSISSRIEERQVSLFDKRKQKLGGWNTSESKVSTGYVLTSDGWGVFPLAQDLLIDKKNFEVVDSRGAVYALDTLFVDSKFGLLYAKIKGDGLRFVSFPAWENLAGNTSYVALEGKQFFPATFASLIKNPALTSAENEIWKPHYISTFTRSNAESIFLTSGEIVALRSGIQFVPGWYIENALDSILSNNILSYSGFLWKGELVESNKENGFVKTRSGFYVTADTAEKDGLKVGDVIIKINNEEFNNETITRVLLKAPKTVRIDFIRGKEILQKTFEKQAIRP